ncbi:hypothetical protein G6F43_009274 [Rhizopus delemar]|nr:hypothetical protein G6F43_009274 [Rhizopus delemar]
MLGLDDSDSSEDEDLDHQKRHKKHIHEDPERKPVILEDNIVNQSTSQQSQLPTETKDPSTLQQQKSLMISLPQQPQPQPQHISIDIEDSTSQLKVESHTLSQLNTLNTATPSIEASNKQEPPILLVSDEESEQEIEPIPDTDIEDLDPDLAAFLKESNETAIEPQKITIKLQYVVPKQSVNDAYKVIIEKLSKPMKVIVMNDEQFDKILTIFCNHKKLKKSEVILSYKEDKVFLRGTPAGVGMIGPETYVMNIYPTHAWEEKLRIEEEKKYEIRSKLNGPEEKAPEMTNVPPEEENKMIIKLRGNDKKEISSTLLSAVTEIYKKITKIAGDVQLYFEGEPMDLNLTIADTELEDEDLLEVGIKNE